MLASPKRFSTFEICCEDDHSSAMDLYFAKWHNHNGREGEEKLFFAVYEELKIQKIFYACEIDGANVYNKHFLYKVYILRLSPIKNDVLDYVLCIDMGAIKIKPSGESLTLNELVDYEKKLKIIRQNFLFKFNNLEKIFEKKKKELRQILKNHSLCRKKQR